MSESAERSLAHEESNVTPEQAEKDARIEENGGQDNVDDCKPSEVADGQGEMGGHEEVVEEESQEYEGGLSDDLIAEGLSQLGRSADGSLQVFLTLWLPGCELTGIDPLGEYVHLQKLILSHNSLEDLSALGNMPHLVYLDISHNKLSSVLDFKPPLALQDVNLSYNGIKSLPDLSAHHSLVKINLDYNEITEIQGLVGCHRLQHLSLEHNKIVKISSLDNLPLKALHLGHNCIKKIENLETLKFLQTFTLAGNSVRSMKGLQNHDLLQEIDLEDNQIIDIAEVRYIRELGLLRSLNLLGNPIQEMPDYRLSLLFRIQTLTEMDRCKVTAEEKVAAINMFNPPPEVVAARDHMFHVVRSLRQPTRIHDSTLPSVDTPYPMLILCGPVGSGKRYLSRRLCQEFPDFFGYGVSHTTRSPVNKEENGEDYFFVTKDEFEHGVMEGHFLETCQLGGHWYGVTREAVERVARDGLAAVFHMELEGVLSFKNTYFEPRYVLVVPVTKENHVKRLEQGSYNDSQISHALDSAEKCLKKNQDSPGFFDMAINSDDLGEAYKNLKRLIMEYLGMSPPSTVNSADLANSSTASMDTEETLNHTATDSQTTSVTINVAATTWSRKSDSSAQPVKGGISSTGQQKTPVEILSFQRRQTLAKAAVAGVHCVSLQQIGSSRQSISAKFGDSSTRFSLDVKRSSSLPLDLNPSLVSMVANASSPNEPKEQFLVSKESDSEDDQESASTLLSSARAYSNGDPLSPRGSDGESLLEPVDFLAFQDSGSFEYSADYVRVQEPAANSI